MRVILGRLMPSVLFVENRNEADDGEIGLLKPGDLFLREYRYGKPVQPIG